MDFLKQNELKQHDAFYLYIYIYRIISNLIIFYFSFKRNKNMLYLNIKSRNNVNYAKLL